MRIYFCILENIFFYFKTLENVFILKPRKALRKFSFKIENTKIKLFD